MSADERASAGCRKIRLMSRREMAVPVMGFSRTRLFIVGIGLRARMMPVMHTAEIVPGWSACAAADSHLAIRCGDRCACRDRRGQKHPALCFA
jgi:hypothetical protein